MAITIKKVSTKRELKKFIRFNYRMYKGNPYSVPDLYDDMLNTFNKKKNAAFEFCEADYFLAYRDDKIVGRVAAIINNQANEKWESKNVRFGWIDFIDDPEVSSALIKAVEDWGKERGMTHIAGPLGFTDFDAEGMLIEGFDQLSTMATIYNYPYYPVHMEKLGFEKDADWVEYKIYIPDAIPDKHKRISELIQRKYNLKIKKYSSGRKIAKDYGQKIFELMNEAYSPLYGYSPLTQRQIDQYVKMYLPILDLRMVTLITDANDELVCVGISMPSLAEALQKSNGRLLPLGWFYLLKALFMKRRAKMLDLLLVAVKPEYQNKGVNALLFSDLIPVYQKLGFIFAESNPELELNGKVQAQWDYFETQQHKRRRAFIKEIKYKTAMEENELIPVDNNNAVEYTDDNIRHLSDMEHVRTRPGMYIGRLGDGAHAEDGIYVLLKEVIDNSIDEFKMQAGKKIEITVEENLRVSVRDYGRGIPQGKLIEAVSMLNTGGKYDSKAFKKSVGLNGVGVKAVNALSSRFEVRSYRDGKVRIATFSKGNLLTDETKNTEEENGTYIFFEPDNTLFLNYCFKPEFIETMLRNYTYLNTGLAIIYNGHRILSRNGLVDLLNDNMTATGLYPIIHLKGEDIEIAFTHTGQYGEEYYSFVNGQHTTQGGTHQSAFKEHIARTIKEFFNKNMDYTDIRNGLVAAIAVNVEEPIFESQTKTKLGSTNMVPGGVTVNKYVGDFIKQEVDNFLHKNADIAEAIQQKIQESEKERKAIAGVTKLARERAKKANLHNRKLRDCRIHLNDPKGKGLEEDSCIFITEGDSASGSITKSRDVNTQAVFSLRGKPLNSFGLTKKVVYENEEFNLLQAALNIEDGIEGLRYNKVIVATDADVDGMHIRLLLITFFLQFFPDLIKKGHVYILQTPLFRVRNKKKTNYCYSEEERINAINELGPNPEITRFKGLGEISPDEFKHFIGKDMRLEQVTLRKTDAVKELLEFYMGKNTMERQNFIIDNLVIEEDLAS